MASGAVSNCSALRADAPGEGLAVISDGKAGRSASCAGDGSLVLLAAIFVAAVLRA
jgi:hypothetical protein